MQKVNIKDALNISREREEEEEEERDWEERRLAFPNPQRIHHPSHPPPALTTGPWMLDGDEDLAQTLCFVQQTLVGVGVAILSAHGLVDAVAVDWIAGAAGF